ncbi:MAG TPA: YkgJ family cysteine cluster protein [Syntrophobacteraceae bacterium]|nr:YkgJ family cysteine cluster protein [Syntrophobacteraceae bacterium]
MVEARLAPWSDDSAVEIAAAIQNALNTASYQHRMARCLFEIACLEGLERLPGTGGLPLAFLVYFQKVLDLFGESTRLSLKRLRKVGFRVQCRSECSHCCYQMPTGLSTAELIYLYHGMHQSGTFSRFFRRCLEAEEVWVEVFRRQTNSNPLLSDVRQPTELASKAYRSLDHPCPFLQGQVCQVYPYRPFACRMHFSLSSPHWCRPSHFQNAYALGFNLEPSKIVSDALEKLENRFNLQLSDVMVCGLLELAVNVVKFQRIRWL